MQFERELSVAVVPEGWRVMSIQYRIPEGSRLRSILDIPGSMSRSLTTFTSTD